MTVQALAEIGVPSRMDPLLRMAVLQGGAKLVQLHIRRGVGLDACDERGATPLMLAASKGHFDVCRVLVEAGADIHAVDRQGRTVLSHASQSRNPDLVGYLSELFAPKEITFDTPSEASGGDRPVTTGDEDEKTDFGWVAVLEPVRPKHDERALQRANAADQDMSFHHAKPYGVDWSDVLLTLPILGDCGAKESFGPLDDWDLREGVEQLLLKALRSGRVREADLSIALRECAGQDIAASLRAALRTTLGDLGVLFDSADPAPWRDGVRKSASPLEKESIDEALTFVASQFRDSFEEPDRFRKEYVRTSLLDREDEAVLARRLHTGLDEALAIVARSGTMLGGILEAGRQVMGGRLSLSSMVDGAEAPGDEAAEDVEATDGLPDTEAPVEEVPPAALILPANFVAVFLEIETLHGRMVAVGGPSLDPGLARSMRKVLRALDPSPRFLRELAALRPADVREQRLVDEFRLSLERVDKARDRFITANLRLVTWVANQFRNSGLELADLVQESCLGLIRACEKFDSDRGSKFSTYAIWWIRQAMWRGIADRSRMIRLPVHAFEKHRKIQRLVRAGLDPGTVRAEDLATAIGVDERLARNLLRVHYDTVPLDDVLLTDLEDGLAGEHPVPDPEEAAIQAAMRRTLVSMVADLSGKEAMVIRLRFGLEDGKEHTLEEVGQMFDVTRERIRQIESKALEKLRHPGRCKRLKDFV